MTEGHGVELSTLLAFAGVATMLIAIPGPDWAFVLGTGGGGRPVMPAVGGLVAGYVLLSLLVAAGVGTLAASSPLVLATLTVVGASYLIGVGTGTIRTARESADPDATGAPARPSLSGPGLLRRGIGVSALNPKALLFFLALLPQFAHPADSWPIPVQLVLLGGVWALICAAFYTLLGCLADRVLHGRAAPARMLRRVAGVAMLGVGIVLLAEQLAHGIG